jgi:RHS repeat-associated protein
MPILIRLRHSLLSLLALLAVAVLLTSSVFAQDKRYTENKADQSLKSDARVDPSTLGMSLEIPLGGAPGRAGTSVSSAVRYSSKLWRLKYAGGWQGNVLYNVWTKPTFSENAMAGWTSSLDVPRIEYTGQNQKFDDLGAPISDDPQAQYYWYCFISRIHLHLPDGSSHELRKSDTPQCLDPSAAYPDFTGTFYSTDGAGMRFDNDTGVLYLPDGGRYFFGTGQVVQRYNNEYISGRWATQYIDRNGNTVNYSFTSVTDTLGRSQGNPLATNPAAGNQTYNVPGVGGQTVSYTLVWANLTDVRSNPSDPLRYTSNQKCISPNNYQDVSPSLFPFSNLPTRVCAATDVFDPVVLQEVQLPNGQKYQFKYNVFGEVDKIIYPTGGYERFLYGQVQPIDVDSSYPYDQANRGVLERWVSPSGDGSEESTQHWVYTATYSQSTGWMYKSTVLAPNGTRSEQMQVPVGGDSFYGFGTALAGLAYEESTFVNSTNQMLRRSLTGWAIEVPSGSTVGRNPHVVKSINLILDTGGNALAAASTTQYDADLNPISTNSYDYASIDSTTAQTGAIGSIALGTLVRTAETTYLVNDTAISSTIRQTYRDRQLLGLPSSSRVKNAAGTIMAQSEVKYDETGFAPLTCGAIHGWTDPGAVVRGMPTTMRSWLNPGGTWLETHAQYDQCGSPRMSWDARDPTRTNPTQIEYSSTYDYGYPTSTISADPDGTGPLSSLTSSTAYDVTTGAVNSTTDANNQITNFSYDTKNRLSLITRPTGGGSTSYEYGTTVGSLFTKTRTAQDATRYIETYQYFDGLGRASRSFLNESGSYVTTDTQYDNMGRTWRVSNPYRVTNLTDGVNPSGLWTSTVYDALGRALTVTTPDGAAVISAYSGQEVTVTDQAGKKRKSVTDGLGRLKEIYEDPTSSNYLTSYTYDVLDSLLTVTQGSQTRTFVYDSLKRLTSAANPESGTIGYQYDSNGNLLVKTDARGASTHLAYDDLNRLTRRWYNGSSSTSATTHNSPTLLSGVVATDEATYTYDAVTNSKGRLTSVSSTTSATNYTAYDAMGRLTAGNQVTDGQTYSMTHGYDLASNQISMSYPSGRVVETEYDSAGRMAGVKQQSGAYYAGGVYTDATNRLHYAAHGAVDIMKLGNGLWEHTTFNNRLQPTQIGLGTSSTDSSTVGLSYTYGTTNNNGNVLTHSYAGGGLSYTQTFEYDALNRLTVTGEGAGSWSETNLYDRYGNRSVAGGLSFSDITNRITTAGYSYDGAGNLKNDPTQSFVFDAENKIKTVNGEGDVYLYDGDGNRVRKNFLYGEKVRMVYSGGLLIAEYDLSNTLKKEYVYGAKGLIATIEPGAVINYTTADHLGTPRVVTNSSAGLVSRHDYKPFGQEVGSGIGGRTTGMGYGATDGVREKFTGYERDTETGLDYAQARYFSGAQGRFTSVDPLMTSARATSPQSWNRYSYVLNKPLTLIDPSGLSARSSDGGCSAEFSNCDGNEGPSGAEEDYEGRLQHQRNARAATTAARNADWDTFFDLMARDETLIYQPWVISNLGGLKKKILDGNKSPTPWEGYINSNGRRECATLPIDWDYMHEDKPVGPLMTANWHMGDALVWGMNLRPGTVVATFDRDQQRYLSARSGNHTAIFLSWYIDRDGTQGMWVIEQGPNWRPRGNQIAFDASQQYYRNAGVFNVVLVGRPATPKRRR